jgi:hypothetical protein
MAERVIEKNEISLNGKRYKTKQPVQSTLASIYPAKVVIGDTTRDSQQRASVVSWSDWRGGIGIERMFGATQADRAWWSHAQTRSRGHLVLPPLATQTAASGVSGIVTVGAIGEFSDTIFASFGTSVRSYNNVADSWGSDLTPSGSGLPAAATDSLTVRIAGTVTLIFAYTTGYAYSTNGTSFTLDNDYDMKYLASWDNRVWGIDVGGQLRWTDDLSGTPSWTNDALLPLPNNYVTDLFVSRDATGEAILYANTSVGLYAHDSANGRFVETELTFPFHPNSGKGSTKWRDSLYIPAAEGVLRYAIGPNAVVTTMGPDRDDGLFNEDGVSYTGRIASLVPSHNDLIALLDATVGADPTLNMHVGSSMGSDAMVIQTDLGRSAILAWNEIGWQVLWTSEASTRAITYAHVSNAYSTYRLWWSHSGLVYFMDLPQSVVNPKQVSVFRFAASGEHITPWFNADQSEVDKLGLSVRIEVEDASSTETVKLEYATNYDTDRDNYTTLGTISSNGTTEFVFPNSTTPTGIAFRSIRFRLTFARGAAVNVSPDVVNMTFVYRKKLPAKWGHSIALDLSNRYKGRTPLQQRADLLSTVESTELVEFTFREDTGNDRNFYVDVVQATGVEMTGRDERGDTRITVVEP